MRIYNLFANDIIMELKRSYFSILLLTILFVAVSCSTKQKEVLQNEEFNMVKQKAAEENQRFCIVLLDTADVTSKIYEERLEKSNIGAIFNVINTEMPQNSWYRQWLYSNSAPITCIFTSSGELVDIIPGASRKCFNCIKQVVKKDLMCKELKYYNNFSMEKRELIPLLNEILQCKLDLEKGVNIESRIDNLLDSIKHPYVDYLRIMNSLNHKENNIAQSAAKHLLTFNNDFELEVYPELFSFSKGIIDPNYDPRMEPVLECEGLIHLDNCEKDIAKPFEISISNMGETPLEVLDIQLDCSCVTLRGEKTYTISPHQSQNINFDFTANKEGQVIREIFLKSNSIRPIKRIKIIANSILSERKEVL